MKTQFSIALVGLLFTSSKQAFVSSLSRRTASISSTSRMVSSSTTTASERSGQSGKIWDRFAEGYSKRPIADEEAYQTKLKTTQKYLKPNMNVLEIGCGTGGTSLIHAPFVHHILATDISTKMINIAQQKAKDQGVKNVEFRLTSIDQLDLPKESQDVVLGLSILHLLKNKDEAIAKTYEWLKPGGLFVTSTTCIGDMGFATNFFLKTILPVGNALGLLPYVNRMTKTELRDSLTKAGFSIEHEWQPKEDAAVFIIGKKV